MSEPLLYLDIVSEGDLCAACGAPDAWVVPYLEGGWPERVCHACARMLARVQALALRFRSTPGNPRSREERTEGGTGGWGPQDFLDRLAPTLAPADVDRARELAELDAELGGAIASRVSKCQL